MSADYLYVDLDSLLDVRLGTLAVHHPEVFAKIVNDDAYYLREMDDFTAWGGPDREAFQALYAKRGIAELQASIMTAMPMVVKNIMGIMERDFEETPHYTEVGMDINIYPYELQDDEIEDLSKIMMVYGGINITPQVIRIAPADLTPDRIEPRYKGVLMYDFRHWLEMHQPKLKPIQLMRCTFHAPWLVYGALMTPDQLEQAGLRREASHREMTEISLREFLFLEYLPATFFSSYRPDLIERVFPLRNPEIAPPTA